MELKGRPVAQEISTRSRERIQDLRQRGIKPGLVLVRLGENPDDIAYERSILKYCQELGVRTRVIVEDKTIASTDFLSLIEGLNQDDLVDGILVFRPLPKHLDTSIIANSIRPDKDLDAMNSQNLLDIFLGERPKFYPSTARGVMELLNYYKLELSGKNVVVVNRSQVVGKPLAMMLLQEDATVTICHSKTKDLRQVCREADIVITALGQAKYFDTSYFNLDSIVIDVGMSLDENSKLSGDVDYESVSAYVKHVTPVPGGLGRITTSVLINQLIENIKED